MNSSLLTLFGQMELSIKHHSIKSGWSIIQYILRSHGLFFPKILYLFLWIDFVLANSADPDEILQYATLNLGLHCLPKYLFRSSWSTKGYSTAICNFGLLPLHFGSLYTKRYGARSDCSIWSSLIWIHTVCIFS